MNKLKEYKSPLIEVIEIELEGLIAESPGSEGASDLDPNKGNESSGGIFDRPSW